MRRPWRMGAFAALLAVLGLVGVIAVRTHGYGPPPPAPPVARTEVAIDPDAAASRLAQALQVQTVSHSAALPVEGANFARFRDLLETNYPNAHEAMTREIVAGHSLLFTWPGKNPSLAPILFSAHMDVVPAEGDETARWTYSPFAGRVADGYIWGRGALDMKQALIGYMEAVEALIASGFTPKRTIFFAFSHDEELNGHGAEQIAGLLRQRGTRLALTWDEGLVISTGSIPGVAQPVAIIGVAQKGYATVELSLSGAGGHASMPPSDPLMARMARAIVALSAEPPPARLAPPAGQMLQYLGPDLPLLQRMALANRWLFEPVVLSSLEGGEATNAVIRTTLAPTRIFASEFENVLPQTVRALYNVRILPGDTLEGTLAHMRRQVDDPEIVIRSVGLAWKPSSVVDPASETFRIVEAVVRSVFPDVLIAPGLMFATSDTRNYGDLADLSLFFIPSRLDDADLNRIHGIDERVSIENFAEIILFYATLMRELGDT